MGSSDTISFPSEPPDIGNWFSSYVYQSPELNSIDDFKDCRESRGNDLGDNEKVKENRDVLLVEMKKGSNGIVQYVNSCGDNKCTSEDLGSSDYLSLSSEPPDIKNWFSSYVYESPVLDSGDAFVISDRCDDNTTVNKHGAINNTKEKEEGFRDLPEAVKCDLVGQDVTSAGLVKCIHKVKDNKNDDHQVCKDLGSSDYLSLSSVSEPLDIKNWFSSYEYESPALDSSDAFIISDHNDNNTTVKEHGAINDTKEKEKELRDFPKAVKCDLLGQDVTSAGLVKCIDKVEDYKNDDQQVRKYNHEANGNKDLAGNLKRRGIDGNGSTEKFRLNKGSSNGDLERRFSGEANHRVLEINDSDNNGRKSPRKLISVAESFRAKHSTELLRSVVNEKSLKEAIGGSNEKENYGNEFPENGFVSTRASKSILARDENHMQKLLGVRSCSSKAGVTDSLSRKKDAVVRRKILSETTNFQQPNILEITGKWKCPQKNKPNLGPPLKQLRLEQWVRRA